MLIDTHAHLDFPNYNKDRDIVIKRAFNEGLSAIITVGFDLNSSKKAVDITETYENIYAIIGVHPHEAKMVTKVTLDEIKRLSENKKVVGIGETGLDFYRNLSPKDRQVRAFSDFTLQIDRQLHSVVIAPHGRLALGYLLAFRHVVPAIGLMVDRMEHQPVVLWILREVGRREQRAGRGRVRQGQGLLLRR